MEDLFTSALRLPPRVCVVAPGPRGLEACGRIPEDCFVIAVSKAVLIPGLKADLWLMNHSDQDWYPAADAAFRGPRVYAWEAAQRVRRDWQPGWYCYVAPPETLAAEKLPPIDGFIRKGASVSSCAVQLAYNFGAREILLCGVDMAGDSYWDGTSNVQPTHGETWPAVRAFDRLIRWLVEERGRKVHTLSETRLNVPFLPVEAVT